MVEAVVDLFEPSMPLRVTLEQAAKFALSLGGKPGAHRPHRPRRVFVRSGCQRDGALFLFRSAMEGEAIGSLR